MNIYAKKAQLKRRLENNYHNFKLSMWSVSRSKLFEMASHIAAVTETYEFLTDWYEWHDEVELDFYLMFYDPLAIIAEAWESRRDEGTTDVDAALMDLSHKMDIITEYPLAEEANAGIGYIVGSDID